uniref:Uncharacterized protein n=1 Tax=Hordeum vulgare subsp. vulgare TaxID=112509 RepID=A0A8I7B3D4_HORVV
MVLVSASVDPRPVYDSDVEVCEPEIRTDIQILAKKLNLIENENNNLKEKLQRVEEEKMILELDVVDVRDDHKIKMNAMRLKIRNIRKYTILTEAWYHYVVGSICTLVAVMIAFVVAFKFSSFNVCSN